MGAFALKIKTNKTNIALGFRDSSDMQGFEDMMSNFMGKLDPFVKYTDTWSNIILGVSIKVLPKEII